MSVLVWLLAQWLECDLFEKFVQYIVELMIHLHMECLSIMNNYLVLADALSKLFIVAADLN